MNEPLPAPDIEPLSRREQRPAHSSRGGTWAVGLILILLGGLFLMRTTGALDIPVANWWALFLLLPATGTLSAAWRTYLNEGRLEGPGRVSLLVGLVLTFIALMFLFGINWSYVGPLLLIVVGMAIALNFVIASRE